MRRLGLGQSVTVVLVASLAMLGTPAEGLTAISGPPTAVGTGGAVATVDRLATEAATGILRQGGNAVDAAVAAAAVLGVTEPFSCGVGGGGFMTLFRASDGRVTTIDHRETAPAAMTPTSFFENGQPLGFDAARYSGLSVGVPGTVAGWAKALSTYGTMTLAQVLAPAIRVALQGFVIDQVFFDQVQATSTTSTTSPPPPACSSTLTGRRRTSAPSSATPSWLGRTR